MATKLIPCCVITSALCAAPFLNAGPPDSPQTAKPDITGTLVVQAPVRLGARVISVPREGVLVQDLAPDSLGAEAGLQKGDVIQSIDGLSVMTVGDLEYRLQRVDITSPVALQVRRNDQVEELSLPVREQHSTGFRGSLPSDELRALPQSEVVDPVPEVSQGPGWIGVDVDDSPGRRGLLIIGVRPDSPALNAGLQPGDLIIKAAGRPVTLADTFVKQVLSLPPGSTFSLSVLQGGYERLIPVEVAVRPVGISVETAPVTTAPISVLPVPASPVIVPPVVVQSPVLSPGPTIAQDPVITTVGPTPEVQLLQERLRRAELEIAELRALLDARESPVTDDVIDPQAENPAEVEADRQ